MAQLPQYDDATLMQLQAQGQLSPQTVNAIQQSRNKLNISPEEASAIDSAPIPPSQMNRDPAASVTSAPEPAPGSYAHAQWEDAQHGFIPKPTIQEPPKPGTFADAQLQDLNSRTPPQMPGVGPKPASSSPSRVDLSQLATPGAQPSNSGLPPLPTALMGDITKSYDRMGAAVSAEAAAQKTGYENQAKVFESAQKTAQEFDAQVKGLQEQRKADADSRMQRLETAQTELEKAHSLNPNKYWQDMGTGGKVASIIGIMLGGFGGGLTGKGDNPALDILHKNIDRDIDAQKQNYDRLRGKVENQRSAYSMAMNEFGNQQSATLAAKASALQMAEIQLKQVAAKTDSQAVKSRADYQIAQIGKDKAQIGMQLNSQIYQMSALRQATGGGGIENPAFLPEDMQKKAVKMPNGMFRVAASEEGAKEIAKTSASANDMKATLSEMRKLQAEAGTSLPYSEASAKASSLMSRLMFQNQQVEGISRLSEPDIHLLQQQMADPTGWRQGRSAALLDQMGQHIDTKMDNLYTQYLPGFKPMKKGAAVDMRK